MKTRKKRKQDREELFKIKQNLILNRYLQPLVEIRLFLVSKVMFSFHVQNVKLYFNFLVYNDNNAVFSRSTVCIFILSPFTVFFPCFFFIVM